MGPRIRKKILCVKMGVIVSERWCLSLLEVIIIRIVSCRVCVADLSICLYRENKGTICSGPKRFGRL